MRYGCRLTHPTEVPLHIELVLVGLFLASSVWAMAVPGHGEWIKRVPEIVKDQLSSLIGDDLMGSKTLLFPVSRLSRLFPRPGLKKTEKHRFGGNSGDLPFEIAGGPDYDLFIQIERVG